MWGHHQHAPRGTEDRQGWRVLEGGREGPGWQPLWGPEPWGPQLLHCPLGSMGIALFL